MARRAARIYLTGKEARMKHSVLDFRPVPEGATAAEAMADIARKAGA